MLVGEGKKKLWVFANVPMPDGFLGGAAVVVDMFMLLLDAADAYFVWSHVPVPVITHFNIVDLL